MSDTDFLNNETKEEYIICAANWFNDGRPHDHQPKNIGTGFVVCGRRHHNCYTTAFILAGEKISEEYNEIKKTCEQGFLTSKNRFLDRKEAAEIAFRQGQVEEQPAILFSEHLY